MSLLFVNACMREGSRTERLARMWLERRGREDVVELDLGKVDVAPLDVPRLALYNKCVAAHSFEPEMFDVAKQFAAADEILIAAPLWNYGIPAKLHDYLELVCTQGLSFDLDATGTYVSLCRAERLTYVMTAGGPEPAPEDEHAFGFVRTLATRFWHVPQIERVAAWSLDFPDVDIDAALEAALG